MRTNVRVALSALVCVCASATIEIPGDARRGQELFKAQGCVQCHSINGQGGKVGPDLGKRLDRNYTPSLLASTMWNHAPRMWSAFTGRGLAKPQLTKDQAADLFAYFYSARYFEQPGDAGRGKAAFGSKGCASCHAIAGRPGAGGAKPVAEWKSLNDPILLAMEMWNHATQMEKALAGRKGAWPVLTSQELADMLVYLQTLPQTQGRQTEFAAASAVTGAMLYEAKGCAKCHAGRLALANRYTNRTLTDFAVAMWNHRPKMGSVEALRPEEMRRIVGYLWSLQTFDKPGNPERGKKVFAQDRCASCHETGLAGAPKLSGKLGLSALSMVSVLWQHGPAMLQQMSKMKTPWPRFDGSEMADLLAFLNSKR